MHVQSECRVDSRESNPIVLALLSAAGWRVLRTASRQKTETKKMTNRWLKGVAVVALTAVGAVAAQAADLPTRKEAPAPIFVPPPFTWTGFYVGLNAGGIWPSGSRNASILDTNPATAAFVTAGFPGGLGSQSAGFLGGGQAGYNWQTGAFVLGVETDFDGSTLSKKFNNVGSPFAAATGLGGDFLTVNGKNSLTWLGTTRARLGFVATPDNRLMIYATGGVAYGGGNSQFSVFDATHGAIFSGTPSSSRVGWVIGGGAEYAVTNNITIKGEYLYADLGSTNFNTTQNIAATTFFPGVSATGKIAWNASIFRAGVNYKF
jgi:outer membrane immunogenic protein